jgi:4-amino-4-deoxy-L-arabinose transferase-like glycosyltransferase
MDDSAMKPRAASAAALARVWRALRGSPWVHGLSIAVLALTLNLAGNARTGLWDRDEPRYAVAVREMRARGDWIVPTFNGEPRYHKPILTYWLMGLSTALAGDSLFGVRLVSALAGSGTCLLSWEIGRRVLGARGGLLAGLMLAVAPIMVAESKLATTDATLGLCLTACQTCLFRLAQQPGKRTAAVFWMCLSLAVLTKGPIGPVFLASSTILAWWWGWPAGMVWSRLDPRRGLLVFAALTVPWYLVVGLLSRGEFFRFSVGNQLLQRVTTQVEQHGGFPGYYLALSILAMYPWSVLMPAAAWAAWRRRKSHAELAFFLGWAVGPWIFLECLPTRLLHYYFPAYTAWALLAAWLVESVAGEDTSLRRWPLGQLGMGLLGGIGLAGTIVTMAGAIALAGPLRAPLTALSFLLAAGTLAGMLWLHRGLTRQAALALGAAWALVMLVAGGWLIPEAEPYRMSRRVGERLAQLERERGIEPVLLNYQEPGIFYAIGHPLPAIRDRQSLLGLIDQKETVISVVTPEEAVEYQAKYGLSVVPIESLEGFSLTKGRGHSLQIATLRRVEASHDDLRSITRTGAMEQTLIK